MQDNKHINWKLMLNNLGPHEQTILTDNLSKLQIGICANNGMGKTFIGKAFASIQASNDEVYSRPMVQWGKKEGGLTFQVTEQNETLEQLEVAFTNNNEKVIKNAPTYLYHVYNQDYVRQNLEVLGYQPNGHIEGIVLGKERIDLSREKAQLQQLKENGITLKKEIENIFETRKKRLKKEDDINVCTTEYKKFTFDEVERNNLYYDESVPYRDLKFEYRELMNLPDEMMDITMLKLNIDINFLDELQNILETSYTKGFFEEHFKEEMRRKESFIELGMSYREGEVCPFCHQTLDSQAQDLIHRYTVYLEDEENKMIRVLKQLQDKLTTFSEALESFYNKDYVQCRREYNCIARYFKRNELLDEMVMDGAFQDALIRLDKYIEDKKKDISQSIIENVQSIQIIKMHMKALNQSIQSINERIRKINRIKNNNDKEKLELRKRICRTVFNETVDTLKPKMAHLNQLRSEYKRLDNQIKEKEYVYRTSKKQLVALTFKQLLQLFFREKYTFDEQNFSLQYANKNLNSDAEKILSTGEKEVIAFCYYLANVHTLVNLEEDYDKVFLVIDDPVAHMDKRYSEYICAVLSQLPELYCLSGDMQYIIMSHNQTFMKMLLERKCIEKSYTLKENNIGLGQSEVAAATR